MAYKWNTHGGNTVGYGWIAIALSIFIMTVIAVIVGVVWKASTGQSGQRVYLWSAFIGMGIFLVLLYIIVANKIFYDVYRNSSDVYNLLYAILIWLIIPICIVLAIGFFITGMINASTGNSTDSLPYLISAVVSFAVIILGWAVFHFLMIVD